MQKKIIGDITCYTAESAELCPDPPNPVRDLLRRYRPVITPAAISKPVEVSLIREIFAESLFPDSPIFMAVDHFRQAALFIATLGRGPDETASGMICRNRCDEASVWDRFTSTIADDWARQVMEEWGRDTMDEGDFRNCYPARYSPGYCRWHIKGQIALFGYLADGDFIVKLKYDGMMDPVKSISGILAIEEADTESGLTASCGHCQNKCSYMRTSAIFCK